MLHQLSSMYPVKEMSLLSSVMTGYGSTNNCIFYLPYHYDTEQLCGTICLFCGISIPESMAVAQDYENGYNFAHVIDGSETSCIESKRAVDQLFSYQLQLRIETGWTDLSAVILNVHFDRTVVCWHRQVRATCFGAIKLIRRKLCVGRQPISGLLRYNPIHY